MAHFNQKVAEKMIKEHNENLELPPCIARHMILQTTGDFVIAYGGETVATITECVGCGKRFIMWG
jgi:hypothetical protein